MSARNGFWSIAGFAGICVLLSAHTACTSQQSSIQDLDESCHAKINSDRSEFVTWLSKIAKAKTDEQLSASKCKTLSLMAKWDEVEQVAPPKYAVFSTEYKSKVSEFLQLARSSTGVDELPIWWQETMRNGMFSRDYQMVMFSNDHHKKVRAQAKAEIDFDSSEKPRIHIISASITIPTDHGQRLTIYLIHGEKIFYAHLPNDGFNDGLPFDIFCFDTKLGESRHFCTVWANGSGNSIGLHHGMNFAQMHIVDDNMVVFGSGNTGVFLEQFDLETGEGLLFASRLLFVRGRGCRKSNSFCDS